MHPTFLISATNDKIWNLTELLDFFVKHQGQHISLTINPEAISFETLGIYALLDLFEFSQVDIHTCNLLETHSKYNIVSVWGNPWLKQQPEIDPIYHQWNQKKTFLGFFHRPTASRLGIAAYLHKHHADQSHVHFSFESDSDNIQFFEFDKLASYHKESLDNVAAMLPSMPLIAFNLTNGNKSSWMATNGYPRFTQLTGLPHTYQKANGIPTKDIIQYEKADGISMYQDILIDIVGESHVLGTTFYPTEKTARPMWMKKPFIAFSSRNYLDYLHQLGFQTFCNFWDEDYDGYEGKDRYLKILALIDHLAAKPTAELYAMYRDMQPVLKHNYNLLKTTSYKTQISLIE